MPRRAAFHQRVEAAASEKRDRPAATLLESGGKWNALLNAISTWANGVELDRLSVQDYTRYADSGVNWRVREGYGSLFAKLGEGLPVHLGTPVRSVDHRGAMITVESAQGSVRGRAVLVTLPPTLLAAETVRFTPALPAAKLEAAHGVPLGLANKLFLALDGPLPDLPADCHVLGAIDRTATGSYQIRPHGRPMVAAYFGGEFARELETAGAAAMTEFACDQLAALFGTSIRRAFAASCELGMGGRPLRPRLLFLCAAGSRRRSGSAGCPGGRPLVLRRRGQLGSRFLDRSRRFSQRRRRRGGHRPSSRTQGMIADTINLHQLNLTPSKGKVN